ncbi:DUF2339 domain-containing protein [Actinomyces sp.]|uniref:DUF2339 domain-containing protein n=1 Tax=Actinomyces sp. TaxID=29317 RepID=UPI0026DB0D0B|nr:DUF2339 domain-containing protein [Actinomyces sp.]MDO4900250.1 DUF2339 domain-containing protein [Actinomyces sp.]
MKHYDSARLDELSTRLEALEHRLEGLEEALTRLAPDPGRSADPHLHDPYASPRVSRRAELPQTPPAAPVMTPSGTAGTPQREGSVGTYLLSGAAALLVLLAAVSLIALVWEQIPDTWKVGGLTLLSLAMVSLGTTLAESRPRQRVAAATVTGTGGALGFVTIISAVLLTGLPALWALTLMAAWGFVLLLVSWTAQQFFTAVVSTLGALVTVGFACAQADAHPERAAQVWTLVCGYLTALAAVSALLPHYTPRMRRVEWLPATSTVVTGTALVCGPPHLLSNAAPVGIGLLCLPAVVLLAQAHHSGRLLAGRAGRRAAAWQWAGAGAALVLTVLRLGLDPTAPPAARGLIAVALLAAAVVSTAALLPDANATPWPQSVIGVNLAGLLGLGAAAFAVDPRLLLPGMLALALASVPLVRVGRSEPVALLPLTGLAALTLTNDDYPAPGTVELALVAVMICVGLGVLLENGLAPSPYAPPPSVRAMPGRDELLTIAAWLCAADLVLAVPALVGRLTPGGTTAALLAGVCALAMAGLGLCTHGCTPLTLASGARAGALEGARNLRVPLVDHVPIVSRLGFGLLNLQCALMLAFAHSMARSTLGMLRTVPLVVLALALTVAGSHLLLPWLRRTAAAVAIALSQSVALWWSAVILTGASPTSMLITALVLATGAACIVGGFRADATALRHYGLTLVMLVVVKLAVLDLADGNSLTQILALLVAGLACFCLSLAYNRFAREQRRGSSPRPDGVT